MIVLYAFFAFLMASISGRPILEDSVPPPLLNCPECASNPSASLALADVFFPHAI